jgi:hypothetical protein
MSCYDFVQLDKTEKGLLDKTVDATYIIHLVGNGRLKNIKDQLSKYRPTNNLYILFNKGYKKCNKKLNKYVPAEDLIDAFLQVFKHATQHEYNNILVLEDDFIFDEKIKDPDVIKNINNFLKEHEGSQFIYCLGVLPIFLIPYDVNNYQIIFSGGMHACIYSKKLITEMLKVDQKNIIDWDKYHSGNSKKYTYYTPLCYQLFPETENTKHWLDHISTSIGTYPQKFLQLFNLHKSVEPGYTIFYVFSKMVFYVLLLLLLYLVLRYI